jgi:hypothetical protein
MTTSHERCPGDTTGTPPKLVATVPLSSRVTRTKSLFALFVKLKAVFFAASAGSKEGGGHDPLVVRHASRPRGSVQFGLL